MWHGRFVSAAGEYEAAYQLILQKGGHRRLTETLLGDLFTIYMDLGDSRSEAENFIEALNFYQKAFDRAPEQQSKLQAKVKLGDAYAAQGAIGSAVDAFHTLISDYPEVHFHPDDYLYVQARTFAEARIAELLEQHGQQHYAAYDAKAEQILNAVGVEAVSSARKVLREYPNTRFMASCLMKMARHAMREQDFRSAGGHLALLLRRSPKSEEAAEARGLLTVCLEKQGIAPRVTPAYRANLFPPLERKWSFRAEGLNAAHLVDVPILTPAMRELFYVILGKNIYCRRAQDGTLAWKNTAGWLGVSLVDPAPQFSGTRIRAVMPDTPAEAAGMESQDIIIEFNGVAIEDTPTLIRVCGKTPAGSLVKIKVLRRGREKLLEARLAERPAIHDRMDLGVRSYFAGVADIAAPGEKPGKQQQAMVISRDRLIQCVDPVTGAALREFAVDPEHVGRTKPASRGGLAVVGGKALLSLTPSTSFREIEKSKAALWDIATGRPIWRRALDRKPFSDPFVIGDVVIAGESEEGRGMNVTFFSRKTGEELAATSPVDLAGIPLKVIDLGGGKACIAIGREIFCCNVSGDAGKIGKRIWTRRVAAGRLAAFRLLSSVEKLGKTLILLATENRGVEVIEAATGRSLWSLEPRNGVVVQRLTVDQDNLYVCWRSPAENATHIDAISIETGRRAWRATADGLPFASDLLATDSILVVALNQKAPPALSQPQNVALGRSKVVMLDKATGTVVEQIIFKDKFVYALKVVDGVLLIVTQDCVIGFGSREPQA